MLHSALLIPPSAAFWAQLTDALLEQPWFAQQMRKRDFSGVRIIAPTFSQGEHLKTALMTRMDTVFIPPRITTLSAWLAMLPPSEVSVSVNERLMTLYAELRQHAWLKKLFETRRNADLLPLAQTFLTLCDELTQALLPMVSVAPDAVEERWQTALEQLPSSVRHVLSDEAQLVWSIWKSQLDANDPIVRQFDKMMHLAQQAATPLVWISPEEPDVLEQFFLAAYAKNQSVWPIRLDWSASAIKSVYASAWNELLEQGKPVARGMAEGIALPDNLWICKAESLEHEALQSAQTIVRWLQAGKSRIAVIAQDRVVARRIRALLERAHIMVMDETGWKLSTTRAAAALVAWFDVIVTRADTIVLLDFLKSPFLFAGMVDKSTCVMAIEMALRRENVSGGWEAIAAALQGIPAALQMLSSLSAQAALFGHRKTLLEWGVMTLGALHAFGMYVALEEDAAGAQVIAMLKGVEQDCCALAQLFSFAEWRAFVSLQLESMPFVLPSRDPRVVMLPLNGICLRSFDAVWVVGCDARHLPSPSHETLFFANAVRRELGLATREGRQRQQLRAFTELLMSNGEVVLSWQSQRNSEPNPISLWIERLQLTLNHCGATPVPMRQVDIDTQRLLPFPSRMPTPFAPQLMPRKLSASGYHSLVACPYQFFATRMLGLSSLEELSDLPEKRDYGDWVHAILKRYHDTLRDRKMGGDERALLLEDISEKIFGQALDNNAAALGYYTRWRKTIPAYLVWASEHEAKGWHFVDGEQRCAKVLRWENGSITLHGRIDRIDQHEDGEWAVLDYKTKDAFSLKKKLRSGEDHQLAFYGILSDSPIAVAQYVALDALKGKLGDVQAENYAQWQHALLAQIVANMRAIGEGANLPASGIATACQYCEVRGLCRKGEW